MNKQQTTNNQPQVAPPKASGTDLPGEDPIGDRQSLVQQSVIRMCEIDSGLERLIAKELLGDGPVHFKTSNDVKKYMTETGQVPVVRKVKGNPRSDKKHHPADDFFELVESFPTYEDAQQFIKGKLSLLIWSVPTTLSMTTKTRKRSTA